MRRTVQFRTIAASLCLALITVAVPAFAEREGGTSSVVASTEMLAPSFVDELPEASDWAQIPPTPDDFDLDPLFDDDFGQQAPVLDPFEGSNRFMLSFNRGIDRFVFDPMMRGYRFVVPEPARRGVRRVFENLNSPSIFANDLLQLRFADASVTLGRFVLNSTVGAGGLFDVGSDIGWERHESDFGQTLARVGVGAGPYLVLPIFGPNTLRDGVGDLVDILFQPLTYLLGPAPNLAIGTSRGFTLLDENSDAMQALEESSVDYYAALRSAYIQNRRAHVRDDEEDEFTAEDATP